MSGILTDARVSARMDGDGYDVASDRVGPVQVQLVPGSSLMWMVYHDDGGTVRAVDGSGVFDTAEGAIGWVLQ